MTLGPLTKSRLFLMQESFFEFLQRSGEGLDVLVADIGAELE